MCMLECQERFRLPFRHPPEGTEEGTQSMSRNERLRQQRIARSWRQQEVADRLGTSLVTVQRWERGTQQPSAYFRVKLSALFGVSAQELGLLDELFPEAPAEPEATDAGQPAAALPDEPAQERLS